MCCEDPDLDAALDPPMYEILDGTMLRCLVCGTTTDHPAHVMNRYCPRCHVTHDA